MAKRNISYRIDDQSYNKLSTLANTYQVSVNEMARILLIDTLNNNSIDDGTVRELRDDITRQVKN